MTGDNWIAYERTVWNSKHRKWDEKRVVVRLDNEQKPYGETWTRRPATDEEIADETARRFAANETRLAREVFEHRPEWQLAEAIRDRLEMMSVKDHPLDALTVEEWQDLHARIVGKRE